YNNGALRLLSTKKGFRHDGRNFYLKESITWSSVTSGNFSMRYRVKGSIFGNASRQSFNKKVKEISSINPMLYVLGIMNSKLGNVFTKVINPTINAPSGDIQKTPIIFNANIDEKAIMLVKFSIILSKKDWDSFESSWDFITHPL